MTAGIKVLFFNCGFNVPYENIVVYNPDSLMEKIANFQPDVIVTVDELPEILNTASFEIRKKWINIASDTDVMQAIETCYAGNLWRENPKDQPLISVYTPTWNTGELIFETYQSLVEQSYKTWEWVVVDDGSTDHTLYNLRMIEEKDPRVRVFAFPHIGKIGALKDICCRLAYGSLLVEVDHDDLLTDNALWEVKQAFDDPKIGMTYSNFSEFYDDGRPDNEYKDEFWAGRYRDTEYRGRTYKEARAPSIYGRFGPNYWDRHAWFLTIGPNHCRAYRKSELERLGEYNRNLPVADDWDVFFRFFLRSRCYHIDKLLYLYRFRDNKANTTFIRNQSIQDHLALGRARWAKIAEAKDSSIPSLPSKDFNLTNPNWDAIILKEGLNNDKCIVSS